jgi:transcriptional regulator with XRE-family HTH domain
MEIGRRLWELRTARKLSQGDIQKRTGLLRACTSRVENGLIVPSLGTLEKYGQALEIPLYRFFYDAEGPDDKPILPPMNAQPCFGTTEKEHVEMTAFATALSRMSEYDRILMVAITHKLAGRGALRKK